MAPLGRWNLPRAWSNCWLEHGFRVRVGPTNTPRSMWTLRADPMGPRARIRLHLAAAWPSLVTSMNRCTGTTVRSFPARGFLTRYRPGWIEARGLAPPPAKDISFNKDPGA